MRSKAQKQINEASKVLGNLTDKQHEQYLSEGHKKQNKQRASKGGTKSMPKGVYGKVQKKGNKVAKEKGVGIHDKNNPNYKKWKSDAGKKGAERQMKDGIGIHTDLETRREWSRLGGLKTIGHLNRERTCPYCGIKTKGAAYNRWHGENCKHKK
jgi:hypothetical protein